MKRLKLKELQEIDPILQKIFDILKLHNYFRSFLVIPEIKEYQLKLITEISSFEIKSEDLFSELYQKLLENTTKHSKGEFYTYSELVKVMILDIYKIGMKVLDPTCGSGTFLLEIVNLVVGSDLSSEKKTQAINKLAGCDINPIACIMARANIFLSYDGFWHKDLDIRIFEIDLLTVNENDFPPLFRKPLFDLILGNPPWLVLNRIPSKLEKDRVKELGKELGILRGGRYQTSTELTTIFIYKMVRDFLKNEGTIFFVTPASLATGAQHSLFRQFCGLRNIEIWDFDEDIFRIHSICFKAEKGTMSFAKRIRVLWKSFHYSKSTRRIELKSSCIYVPSKILGVPILKDNIKDKKSSLMLSIPNKNLHVGRLIQLAENSNMNQKISEYKKLFRQGASLVPRNLLFVDIVNNNQKNNNKIQKNGKNLICIQPSESIQHKKYSTWEFKAYNRENIEESYIFSIAKSTGLIPFYYCLPYKAFLPLEKDSKGKYHLSPPSSPYSLKHYQNLQEIYLKNKKIGAKIETLEERLNYGRALTDPRQFKTPKVVYGGIGSIVKAAILTDPMIVDTSLYFHIPKSLEEAYYIIGYLNAPFTTQHVKLVGSTGAHGSLRNIHKHPFNIRFPLFKANNKLHNEISLKSHEIESYVKEFVNKYSQNSEISIIKPKTIQNRLLKELEYKKKLTNLNSLIEKLMIHSS
ncbi:MAG: HsdM family class I SAM-dependent methyltransferase [Promethearchaeota archaeon]